MTKTLTNTLAKKQKYITFLKKLKKPILAILIICIACLVFSKFKKHEIQTTIEFLQAEATIGTLKQSLDSSGTIEAYAEFSIVPTASGEILEDFIELSGNVTKDQILYEIDSSGEDSAISRAETTLANQQSTYQEVLDSVNDLNIKSSIYGTVMNVNVSLGDTVSNSTVIANVTNLEVLEITLPFHKTDASQINIGDTASVTVVEANETITGTVTAMSSGGYILSTGAIVEEVKIEVQNPGILTDAYTATAIINGVSCASEGEFYYKYSGNITAKTSGEITNINIMKGDKIYVGDLVAIAYDADMEKTIENAKSTLDDAISSYETTLEALNNYKITSPIDGTIMEKNYKAGDTIQNTNNTTLAVVADMSKVKFEMVVDELNIANINMDTPVVVTADAVEYRTYSGYIESIGLIGSQSSGITTYPIVVVIDDAEGLLPGMNITADIVIDQAVDVVTIPSSYVARGNTVLISSADAMKYETSDTKEVGTVYASSTEGYYYLNIEIGTSDGTSVAVLNGLEAGTTVYMQTITTITPENDTDELGFSIPGVSSNVTSNRVNSSTSSNVTGPRG